MAEFETESGKATTILGLSQEIGELLGKLQVVLDERFSRGMKDEGKTEVRSEKVNVLDEIIEQLNQDRKHLSNLIGFVVSDVLPKIN